ncbi:MAG: hypothetical protein U0271_31275 [Polyangiaceae bacterium]
MLALAACEDPEPTRSRVVSSVDDLEPDAGVVPAPRRPAEHFEMTRITERCAIDRVNVSGTTLRVEPDVACPKDMELGESIRLEGAVCMRASLAPGRVLPVVCPATLLKAEATWRKQQAPASASASVGGAPTAVGSAAPGRAR